MRCAIVYDYTDGRGGGSKGVAAKGKGGHPVGGRP